MNTKNLLAILIIAILGLSSMNAQEMDHSKMKKDTTKMMDHSKMEMKEMYTCPMHADVKSDKPGDCSKCGMELKKMEMKPSYTCSMHPEVVSDKKGECPKCGMSLIEKKMEEKKDNKHKTHKHK